MTPLKKNPELFRYLVVMVIYCIIVSLAKRSGDSAMLFEASRCVKILSHQWCKPNEVLSQLLVDDNAYSPEELSTILKWARQVLPEFNDSAKPSYHAQGNHCFNNPIAQLGRIVNSLIKNLSSQVSEWDKRACKLLGRLESFSERIKELSGKFEDLLRNPEWIVSDDDLQRQQEDLNAMLFGIVAYLLRQNLSEIIKKSGHNNLRLRRCWELKDEVLSICKLLFQKEVSIDQAALGKLADGKGDKKKIQSNLKERSRLLAQCYKELEELMLLLLDGSKVKSQLMTKVSPPKSIIPVDLAAFSAWVRKEAAVVMVNLPGEYAGQLIKHFHSIFQTSRGLSATRTMYCR